MLPLNDDEPLKRDPPTFIWSKAIYKARLAARKFGESVGYRKNPEVSQKSVNMSETCQISQTKESETMGVATAVNQSKWGYHVCDRTTYFKLRRLQYLARKAFSRLRAWERWDRKLPENRVIEQRQTTREGGKITTVIVSRSPMPEPKLVPDLDAKTLYWTAYQAYREAKYPLKTEAEAVALLGSYQTYLTKHGLERLESYLIQLENAFPTVVNPKASE